MYVHGSNAVFRFIWCCLPFRCVVHGWRLVCVVTAKRVHWMVCCSCMLYIRNGIPGMQLYQLIVQVLCNSWWGKYDVSCTVFLQLTIESDAAAHSRQWSQEVHDYSCSTIPHTLWSAHQPIFVQGSQSVIMMVALNQHRKPCTENTCRPAFGLHWFLDETSRKRLLTLKCCSSPQ